MLQIYQKFAKDQQEVHYLRADSHDPHTVQKVKEILGDKAIDFCFIDGDQSNEGVKLDFEMYSSFVRKGGMVAFHDIVLVPHQTVANEVGRFWQQLKANGFACRAMWLGSIVWS
jgi:predicted O-methyltransferase YrrM